MMLYTAIIREELTPSEGPREAACSGLALCGEEGGGRCRDWVVEGGRLVVELMAGSVKKVQDCFGREVVDLGGNFGRCV